MKSTHHIPRRLTVFCISIAVICSICLSHGISGRKRTIAILDQMLEAGQLTGKYWRVTSIHDDRINITKYQRTIALACSLSKDIQIGDRISFIANKEKTNSPSGRIWYPVRIYFHVNSAFKHWISFVSVLIVSIMGFRYLGFDRESFGLILKREEKTDA